MVEEGEGETGTECFGRDVQQIEVYLYADDGLLVYTQAARIQWEFRVMKNLLYCVGLRINVGKMMSMAYQPCRAIGKQSTEAYGLRMMGEGSTHWEII